MASINCNIVNPHYKELLNQIDSWAKSSRSKKNLNNPYEAAFRLVERNFEIDLDILKYDSGQEKLTKGSVNGFIKTLNQLNDSIDSGKLDGNFAQFFYQSSHYGPKDPVIGSYLKEMQNSSFFFKDINQISTSLGYKENQIYLSQNRLDTANMNLSSLLSETEDVDLAEAITVYNSQEIAYRAAMQTAADVLKLNIMD